MTTTVSSSPKENDETDLLHRLQSQFGDLDLTELLIQEETEEEKKQDGDDDESTWADPSPEELAEWQAQQFQKGAHELALKQRLLMTPLQRRRELQKKRRLVNQHQQHQGEEEEEEDEEDWEQVAANPDLNGQTSAFFPTQDGHGNEILGVHPLLHQLAMGDPEVLGTQWRRLYSSDQGDGLSFHHILDTLKGYPGPTVMLIGSVPSTSRSLSTKAGNPLPRSTMGFFTTSSWTESTDFFGSSDCFLFVLDEANNQVQFLRPRSTTQSNQEDDDDDQQHYMYCHPSTLNVTTRCSKAGIATTTTAASKRGTDGSVHGIGIGGTPSQPRVHLTETLEECRAMEHCHLFQDGDLLQGNGADSLYYFDVDVLEVWAVGGQDWIEESLKARQKERDIQAAHLQRARHVNKKDFVNDLRLLNSTKATSTTATNSGSYFGHLQHTAGRCDL